VSVFTAFIVPQQDTRSAISFGVLYVRDISLEAIPERNGEVRNSVDLIISSVVLPAPPASLLVETKPHPGAVRKSVCSSTCRVTYPVGSNVRSDAVILQFLPIFLCEIT
jgi:hypothetical protein